MAISTLTGNRSAVGATDKADAFRTAESEMRAVLCNAFEGTKALNLADTAEPRPAANEVLIDVHAASVS